MTPRDLSRLCIHQVTLMPLGFREAVECFARHGVSKTAVWKEKVAEIGVAEARRILDGEGVAAHSLCAGGFVTDPAARARTVEDNRRWLAMSAELGAKSMVTITGGLPAGEQDLRRAKAHALEGLARLATEARSAGVTLALEPLHPMVCGLRSVISRLSEANDMLDLLAADDVLGIAVDSYALWWDVDLETEIRRAGGRIANFHVSDWRPETRDVRLDRAMPGEGHIDNRRIRGWVEDTGFSGPVEVEIFSQDDWWARPPDETVAAIVAGFNRAF